MEAVVHKVALDKVVEVCLEDVLHVAGIVRADHWWREGKRDCEWFPAKVLGLCKYPMLQFAVVGSAWSQRNNVANHRNELFSAGLKETCRGMDADTDTPEPIASFW